MKKICRTIKLRKYKCKVPEDVIKLQENKEFIICFADNKYESVYDTWDLRKILEKDHIRQIRYIFDLTDRIVLDRDVLINTDEIVGDK